MVRCAYCRKDKGRRECPALGGLISPSCCGRQRGVHIDCPPHCKYFKSHEEYQRTRLGPEFHRAWLGATELLYRAGKRSVLDFLIFLELSIYQYFLRRTRGTDEDLREALRYLERKLGPLEVIETPGSPLGRHLFESVKEYLKRERLAPEEAEEATEKLIEAVEVLISEGEEPRQALQGLLGHVEGYIGVPQGMAEEPRAIETPKIIRPGE